jgi:PucR C-terminal helix-turn-helix domain/GAF domain/GGDEF-like domain
VRATQLDRLTTLVHISRMLTSELDPSEIVHQVLSSAIDLIPAADAGTLYLYDEETDKLRPMVSIGFGPSIYNIALEAGEAAAGQAFHLGHGEIHGGPEAIQKTLRTATPETLKYFREASQGVRTPRAAMTAALVFKSKPLGALVVDAMREGPAFGQDDLEFLEDFARIAAVAIMNARVYESEHSSRLRLEVLNAEITRQRDELDRRLRALDAMLETGRGGPRLGALAAKLAALTSSRVHVLDGIGRVRNIEPPDGVKDAADPRAPGEEALTELVERAGRERGRVSSNPDESTHLVASPITAGSELLGFVAIDTFGRVPDAVDEALVDSAALIASTFFVQEKALEEGDFRRRSDLLHRLLDGDVPKSASSVRPLRPPLVLAVGRVRRTAKPDRRHNDPNVVRALRTLSWDVLREVLPSSVVDVRGDGVVIACSPANRTLTEQLTRELEGIAERFMRDSPDWSVRFAVTDSIKDPSLVPQAWNEANLALKIRPWNGQPVVEVGGLGAYRLIINSTNVPYAVEFSQRILAPVLQHDRTLDGKILSTFRLYLAEGASVTAAARRLGVHTHTVQYRLNKLEELCGLSLRRSEDRLTLELALRILDLMRP